MSQPQPNPQPNPEPDTDPRATMLGEPASADARPVRITAALIADARREHTPGAMVLRPHDGRWRIEHIGHDSVVPEPDAARRIDLGDAVVLPALVNAHTHLDLTAIGPRPHDPSEGFVPWAEMIRAARPTEPEAIADAVRGGVEASLAGGVAAVGDIAGAARGRLTPTAARVLAESPLVGVSFLEYFGIGTTAAKATERLADFLRDELGPLERIGAAGGVRIGLGPHAPNTVDRSLYRCSADAAAARGLPISTHLAETPEERAFVAEASGPQRDMLERFGMWDDSILDHIGAGAHPVEHLGDVLRRVPFLVAHANDAPDRAIEILAATGASVAFCPRAHACFGYARTLGPHRARAMRDAGVRVCLGTDSIVNLDTPDRISVLDEMRVLHAQGGWTRRELIAMASVEGAGALDLDPPAYELTRGNTPRGVIAIRADSLGDGPISPDERWDEAMSGGGAPVWVMRNAPEGACSSD